jgi:hypothetical protein
MINVSERALRPLGAPVEGNQVKRILPGLRNRCNAGESLLIPYLPRLYPINQISLATSASGQRNARALVNI